MKRRARFAIVTFFVGAFAGSCGTEEQSDQAAVVTQQAVVAATLTLAPVAGCWENNQDQNISTNTPLHLPFVTAVVVGDSVSAANPNGRFALYGGDATTGTVKTMYDGIRPAKNGYAPMHKQGGIVLGIGGDSSNSASGQFFEGVMASGAATLATVNVLQANIVAAAYGK